MNAGNALRVSWWDWEAQAGLPAWCATQTCTLSPSLAELLDWPRAQGGVVALYDAQGLAALLPVSVERRRLRGVPLTVAALPGENFFDYLPGICRPGVNGAAVWQALRPWGRHLGWDALELRHQIAVAGGNDWQCFSNRVFTADQDSKGWAFLTRKESLKRHRNRARKSLNYRVEQYRNEIPAALLDEVANLHQERWRFDGIDSLFVEPGRNALYQRQAARAWVTVVRDGTAIVAAHIGFRHGDVLLWHTPVINIRYLDYSPLEILLLETAEACSGEGMLALDFGLGDEAYKARFSNSERPVGNGLWPLTVRGHLVALLRRQAWLDGGGARLRTFLASLRPIRRTDNAVLYTKSLAVAADGEGSWQVFADFAQFVDQARAQHWPLQRSAYDGYRQGLQALAHADGPLCGWVAFRPEQSGAKITWMPEAAGEIENSSRLVTLEAWASARGLSELSIELADRSSMPTLLRAGWCRVPSA